MNLKEKKEKLAKHMARWERPDTKIHASYKGKKGKESLNMPKGEKNEGEKHYLGKDEQPVA